MTGKVNEWEKGGNGSKESQSDSRKQTKINQSDLFLPWKYFLTKRTFHSGQRRRQCRCTSMRPVSSKESCRDFFFSLLVLLRLSSEKRRDGATVSR